VTAATDTLCWWIERDGARALVREDGHVESPDPDLDAELRRRLAEPVTVYRRGTVSPGLTGTAAERGPVELRPGDRRYVVARIRALTAQDPRWRIAGIEWV